MKIRTGFVSNSSTSSFFIYGVALENEQLDAAEGGESSLASRLDGMWKFFDKSELEWHQPDYDYELYVGVSPKHIGNDETGGQFKARVIGQVSELLTSLGVTNIPAFDYHGAAWRDG